MTNNPFRAALTQANLAGPNRRICWRRGVPVIVDVHDQEE
jgi:hypothetical protein